MVQKLRLRKIEIFNNRPILLMILDGVGVGNQDEGDCVFRANTPNLDDMIRWSKEKGLYSELKAHGTFVGLPTDKDIGNSEVGHNAMGAGRVFFQGAELVNQSIENESIFKTDTWERLINIPKENSLHLIGLLSDGNVHSHINHVVKILEYLAEHKFPKVRIHTLLDGRDVPEKSALKYINQIELKLREINKTGLDYEIASGGGRMRVTMDRYESDWGVVKRGWNAHVEGIPDQFDQYSGYFKNAKEAIETARNINPDLNDQYLPSFVIVDEKNKPVGTIQDGDSVIFFNFRGDRAIQISQAFEKKEFNEFERKNNPKIFFTGMLEYDHELHIPKHYLVNPPEIDNTVSEFIAEMQIKQYACAETHKFGHVTYFWNGNRSGYINSELELYEEITSEPTEKIKENPGMKALEVAQAVINALKSKKYQFLRTNFANGDMAGHTGLMEVTIRSMEVMDKAIGEIRKQIDELNGILIITGDHGNAEEMLDRNKEPKTSHTLNSVPFVVYDPSYKGLYELAKLNQPQLANIASTMLFLLDLEPPSFYEDSLLIFK